MNAKSFPIAVILNFADGRLLTTMDDVYVFANFMTGDNLMTHQLPRAFRAVSPALKKQLPFLDSPSFKNEQECLTGLLQCATDKKLAIKTWLTVQARLFGAHHQVTPLTDWMEQDPISELIQMRESKDGIILVRPPEQTEDSP